MPETVHDLLRVCIVAARTPAALETLAATRREKLTMILSQLTINEFASAMVEHRGLFVSDHVLRTALRSGALNGAEKFCGRWLIPGCHVATWQPSVWLVELPGGTLLRQKKRKTPPIQGTQ